MNSKYGNFLSNSALEHEKLKISSQTIDIFNELELTLITYQNSFYIAHNDDATSQIIARDVKTMTCDLVIWREFHCKWMYEKKQNISDDPL